jgi:hypothetical protein
MLSIPRPGSPMDHIAASTARTLPDGAVCVRSPSDPSSGEYVALRIDHRETDPPLRLGPADAHTPGWRAVDSLGGSDHSWTVLELMPGPPDRMVVRRVAADGSTVWQSGATVGAPDSLRSLLTDGAGSVFAVTAGQPPRVVKIDSDGGITDLLALAGAASAIFMDGRGRVGFVENGADSDSRHWVRVDVRTGESDRLRLDPASQWGLDLPLGMDGDGRPYGNRYGTIVRFDADGHIGWELQVQDLVVDEQDIWVARPAPIGTGVEVLAIAGESRGQTRTLSPATKGQPRRWRLVGHIQPDSFMLYAGDDGGTLVTGAPDGSEHVAPAPEDIWLRSFDLQIPTGPSITDAGDIDLVTRGPDALHIIRITPGG